jgi:hypothetical protein
MKRLNLVGQKFWRLTVVEFDSIRLWSSYWKCICECWVEKIIQWNHLRTWHTISCGCGNKHRTTHWMSGTHIHKIWKDMTRRCRNENRKCYKDYWWRGIKVCERRLKFENFRDDMLPTYIEWLTIDRENNNWNYCKENCKRKTDIEQANNKRNNRVIEYNGKIQTVAQWARELWVEYSMLYRRINKSWRINERIFNI